MYIYKLYGRRDGGDTPLSTFSYLEYVVETIGSWSGMMLIRLPDNLYCWIYIINNQNKCPNVVSNRLDKRFRILFTLTNLYFLCVFLFWTLYTLTKDTLLHDLWTSSTGRRNWRHEKRNINMKKANTTTKKRRRRGTRCWVAVVVVVFREHWL